MFSDRHKIIRREIVNLLKPPVGRRFHAALAKAAFQIFMAGVS